MFRIDDFVNDYKILKKFEVGKCVYLVSKNKDERFVLKYFENETMNDEAKIGMALGSKCPFLVKIHEVNSDDHGFYIIMEYCEEGDLSKRIGKNVPATDGEIYRFFYEGVQAIHTIHEADIIHRDIKAGNFFLVKGGGFKLGDYGVARYLESDAFKTMTQVGSRGYTSPEIMEGKAYTSKVDIYSFGTTMLQFILGKNPFSNSDGNFNLIKAAMGEPITEALTHPHPCAKLALKMIALDPSARPSTDDLLACDVFVMCASFLPRNIALSAQNAEIVQENVRCKEECAALARENAQKEEENKQLSDANARNLEEENSRLRSEAEENRGLVKENALQREEIDKLMSELTEQIKKTAEGKEGNAQLAKESARLMDQNRQLLQESAQLMDQNSRLKQESTQLMDQNSRLLQESADGGEKEALSLRKNAQYLEKIAQLRKAIILAFSRAVITHACVSSTSDTAAASAISAETSPGAGAAAASEPPMSLLETLLSDPSSLTLSASSSDEPIYVRATSPVTTLLPCHPSPPYELPPDSVDFLLEISPPPSGFVKKNNKLIFYNSEVVPINCELLKGQIYILDLLLEGCWTVGFIKKQSSPLYKSPNSCSLCSDGELFVGGTKHKKSAPPQAKDASTDLHLELNLITRTVRYQLDGVLAPFVIKDVDNHVAFMFGKYVTFGETQAEITIRSLHTTAQPLPGQSLKAKEYICPF